MGRAAVKIPEDARSNPAQANEFFVARLQCQNNMKLVFRISEDGSEIIVYYIQVNYCRIQSLDSRL
jgi:hypothetical protein